ncbi:MAG: hypothetical protein WC593_08650 [Methanoregula sp.]
MHSAEARHELDQDKPFRLALSPDCQIRNIPPVLIRRLFTQSGIIWKTLWSSDGYVQYLILAEIRSLSGSEYADRRDR